MEVMHYQTKIKYFHSSLFNLNIIKDLNKKYFQEFFILLNTPRNGILFYISTLN